MCLLFKKKCKISRYFSLQIFLLVSLFLLCVSLSIQWTIQQFSIDNIMAFYSGKERVVLHSFACVVNFTFLLCKCNVNWQEMEFGLETMAQSYTSSHRFTIHCRWLMIFKSRTFIYFWASGVQLSA